MANFFFIAYQTPPLYAYTPNNSCDLLYLSMDELKKLFTSEEDLNNEKELEAKLDEIDEKYSHWFSKRNEDTLHNYYRIYNDNGNTSFAFIGEQLPKDIEEDCRQAFNQVYKKD